MMENGEIIMKDFFKSIGEFIVKAYSTYSDFIHSIFAAELGDFVEYLLDIIVAAAIVKLVASVAFRTKGNG